MQYKVKFKNTCPNKMETGKYIEQINAQIAILRVEIEQASSMGLHNLNKYSENFVMKILNLMYGYQLENLNGETTNFPGLDLGDKKIGIAYQVTSTRTSEKVDSTLSKCIKYEHYILFPQINIFITTQKQTSYTIKTTTSPHFSFDWKENVLDFNELLKNISQASPETIKNIRDYVVSELPILHELKIEMKCSLWHLPCPQNPYFTGRSNILDSIYSTFKKSNSLAVTQAIAGLGGIGKTQTAIEYAFRYRNEYKPCFWVVADTNITLTSALVEIAKLLCLPEANNSDQNTIIQSVKKWFETYEGWLLILDNADSPALLKPYLPINPRGHILITSRAHVFDMLGVSKTLDLGQMEKDEAMEFLLKRTNRQNLKETEKLFAERLLAELGYLPLAIEQAGAFILAHQSTFETYFKSYENKKFLLLNQALPVMGDYAHSVATTWSMNFNAIESMNAESANILRLSAFLGPDSIPIELISDGYYKLDSDDSLSVNELGDDPIALDIALQPLTRYSLIHRDISSSSYSIHRLVQESIKSEMVAEMRKHWALKVVRAINNIFPSASYSTWTLCDRLLSHCVLAAQYVEYYNFTFLDAGEFLNGVACYLRMRGDFTESERIHLQSVAIRERDLGPEDQEVAINLNNLALVYYDQYIFSKAEPLLVRALDINIKNLGEDNPDLALAYNNLGLLYVRCDKLLKAQSILERALELYNKSPQNEEFFYAIIINNLAELHLGLGNYSLVEKLCLESLNIRERIGNPEKTGRSYTTMGMIKFKIGELDIAEEFFKKAITNREVVFGIEHPELIIVLVRYIEMLINTNRQYEAGLLKDRLNSIKKKYRISI